MMEQQEQQELQDQGLCTPQQEQHQQQPLHQQMELHQHVHARDIGLAWWGGPGVCIGHWVWSMDCYAICTVCVA